MKSGGYYYHKKSQTVHPDAVNMDVQEMFIDKCAEISRIRYRCRNPLKFTTHTLIFATIKEVGIYTFDLRKRNQHKETGMPPIKPNGFPDRTGGMA